MLSDNLSIMGQSENIKHYDIINKKTILFHGQYSYMKYEKKKCNKVRSQIQTIQILRQVINIFNDFIIYTSIIIT